MPAIILFTILIEAGILWGIIRVTARNEADSSFGKAVIVAMVVVVVNLVATFSLKQRLPPPFVWIATLPVLAIIAVMLVNLCWVPLHKAIFTATLLLFIHTFAEWAIIVVQPPPRVQTRTTHSPQHTPMPSESVPVERQPAQPRTVVPYVRWLQQTRGWLLSRAVWHRPLRFVDRLARTSSSAVRIDSLDVRQTIAMSGRTPVKSFRMQLRGVVTGSDPSGRIKEFAEALRTGREDSGFFRRTEISELRAQTDGQSVAFLVSCDGPELPMYDHFKQSVLMDEREARKEIQSFSQTCLLDSHRVNRLTMASGFVAAAVQGTELALEAVQEIGLVQVPAPPEAQSILDIYAVRVEAAGSFGDALSMLEACESTAPKPSVSGIRMDAIRGKKDSYKLTADIAWPVWSSPELHREIAIFANLRPGTAPPHPARQETRVGFVTQPPPEAASKPMPAPARSTLDLWATDGDLSLRTDEQNALLVLAIHSRGSGTIPPVTIHYYIGTSGGTSTPIGSSTYKGLRAGDTGYAGIQWTRGPGIFQVSAEIDLENGILETNEHNNRATATITVAR